jgi:hypothetical protein
MGEILSFEHSDVPAVASLFMKVFRKRNVPPATSLQQYLASLYLENPWRDPQYSSLTYKDSQRNLIGFIGALPRPMLFRNRRIIGVVAGNHMVDPDAKDPFAGILLLKRLLQGKQDLTFSDSANDVSQRLWEATGAKTLHIYSLRWLRILKPGCLALSLLRRTRHAAFLRYPLIPLGLLIDRLVGKVWLNKDFSAALLESLDGPMNPDEIPELLSRWNQDKALRPDYDRRGFEWILEMARHLQVVAKPGSFEQVFRHLCSRALQHGSVALEGLVDPAVLRDLEKNKCLLFERNLTTIAHSENPEILNSMFRGEAFLTRLDAEWWTRLQGDSFR